MALLNCPDCGGAVSDAAPTCIHCGRPLKQLVGHPRQVDSLTAVEPGPASGQPLETESSAPRVSAVADEHPFFPVATHKFVVMSICTFGIYELYWCFKNWQRIRHRTGENLSPFWRAFFAPLWGFSLFRRIRAFADGQSISVGWSPGVSATFYLLLTASWRLPDPWWLISLASFVPFLAVVETTGQINGTSHATEGANASYSGGNIATIVIGGLIWLLAVVGTLAAA